MSEDKITIEEAEQLRALNEHVQDLDVDIGLARAQMRRALHLVQKKYKLKDNDSIDFDTCEIKRAQA